MTTLALVAVLRASSRRWWPEMVVAFMASVIFLAFLGSVELWGKREQRASAEALDTVQNHHWLVAEIQGRPRLEKPPLPRWTIALLLTLTGRLEEWLVRLPGAVAGLATAALVYALGSRMGGRKLALVSTLVLCTMGLFVVELRQAGNDGPLALFTTLSLYAAWRSLNVQKRKSADRAGIPGGAYACRIPHRWAHLEDREVEPPPPGIRTGRAHFCRRGPTPRAGLPPPPISWLRLCRASHLPPERFWAVVFHGAMGLGFLCKGPIILLLVGLTVVPYLAITRRLAVGGRRLAEVSGLLLFLALALSWPARVLAEDPNAWGVWMTEIGQKTGILPIAHRQRVILALELPALALPWSVMAIAGIALPLVRNRRVRAPGRASSIWFAWWWVVGSLAVFSTWAVAKPNYFIPCLPGLAILAGMAWIRLTHAARAPAWSIAAALARLLLGVQWLSFLLVGILVPILTPNYLPEAPYAWLSALGGSAVVGVALGWRFWRSGQDLLALLPVGVAAAFGLAVGYGMIAPAGNAARGHRQLAGQLEQLVPRDVQELRFFHEIDEGLWFYLRAPRLAPVPGSQPHYSDSFDKLRPLLSYELSSGQAPDPSIVLRNREKQLLLDWLRRRGRDEPYLLIRDRLYERLAPDLSGLAVPVFREGGLRRTQLVLLRTTEKAERSVSSRPVNLERTLR